MTTENNATSPESKNTSADSKASLENVTTSPDNKTTSPENKTASPENKTASPENKTTSPEDQDMSYENKNIPIENTLETLSDNKNTSLTDDAHKQRTEETSSNEEPTDRLQYKLTRSTILHRCSKCRAMFVTIRRVEEHCRLKHGGGDPQAITSMYTSQTYDEHYAEKKVNAFVRACQWCTDACVVFTAIDDLKPYTP